LHNLHYGTTTAMIKEKMKQTYDNTDIHIRALFTVTKM